MTQFSAQVAGQIEAVLFVADRPVSVSELARLLGIPADAVEDALVVLDAGYDGRGIALQRQGDSLQLVSHPQNAAVVQRFLGLEMSARLSPAALETLAIVAYRQPVTRSQIEQIRGVNADHAVGNLLMRELIEEVGRLETVGRPILYGTTFEFLRAFGLRSLSDLPPVGEFGQPSGSEAGEGASTAPADSEAR
jgi:segregation and condensation protein B